MTVLGDCRAEQRRKGDGRCDCERRPYGLSPHGDGSSGHPDQDDLFRGHLSPLCGEPTCFDATIEVFDLAMAEIDVSSPYFAVTSCPRPIWL